jgi:hypothetical protein
MEMQSGQRHTVLAAGVLELLEKRIKVAGLFWLSVLFSLPQQPAARENAAPHYLPQVAS